MNAKSVLSIPIKGYLNDFHTSLDYFLRKSSEELP